MPHVRRRTWRAGGIALAVFWVFTALPAFGQLDRVVAEAVEGDIDCLPCAVTIEFALKQVEGVNRISVSMGKQMVAITFKEGARFTPDKYRSAIAKAEVRVKTFNVAMRGKAEQAEGKTYFVAGQDRFQIASPPKDLPLGVAVGVMAVVDDSTQPYTITSISDVKRL
jgi:copper chaperone CopZ